MDAFKKVAAFDVREGQGGGARGAGGCVTEHVLESGLVCREGGVAP